VTYSYPDLPTARRGILCDAVQIATDAGKPFLVIGGWSPFILNQGTIAHPGTYDVDLLFERAATERELETVVNAFLSHGYISSAKHSFQLLRVARVRGRDFVFNVDFLHSGSHEDASELFVDHLVLDDGPLLYRYQSILVPMSTLLFEEDGRVQKVVEGTLPTGAAVSVTVPLMTELGTLLTKSQSMFGIKRTRDAFDVMLAICQARDRVWLADAIRQNGIEDRLGALWCLLSDSGLRDNIARYWPGAKQSAAWTRITETIASFLAESGIEEPLMEGQASELQKQEPSPGPGPEEGDTKGPRS